MPLGTPFFHSQSAYRCLSVKIPENSALVISFIPFKNLAVAWMNVVRGSFGMLSDCRLFTHGTRGIMFHSPRSLTSFALTNVGEIAVFAFNPVNNACYFFFRWTVFRFFEDRSKCAYGLKSSPYVEMLQCAFYPVRYPLNIGYHGKASRVRMVASWTRPWLGSTFNEFGGISIDL